MKGTEIIRELPQDRRTESVPKLRDRRTQAAKRRGERPLEVDPLTAYMNELRRHPMLDREQEHVLAIEYARTRDPAIAKRLLTSNLRLVVKIAHEYRRSATQMLDLVQEGNLGLITALEKFDPHRGVKLSTYATWWIRAYMLEYILDNEKLVRVGTTTAQRKLFFGLRKQQDKLVAQGVEPTAKRIARVLHVPERDVVEMDQRLAADLSLDAPTATDDGEGRSLQEVLPSSDRVRPDVVAEDSDFRVRLREKLRSFGEQLEGHRARYIFEERLLKDSPETLQDIGARYGISRERARQLESRLKAQLREYLEDELGDALAA